MSQPTKTRFALMFLRAMRRLNKRRPPSTSASDKYKRYLVVRAAADMSMASAVGTRRAWSRAVLDKIRNRSPTNKRKKGRPSRKRVSPRRGELLGFGDEDELRRVVPGGEGMGYCRLLSESAHYIECLRDQVQVMTSVLRHYST